MHTESAALINVQSTHGPVRTGCRHWIGLAVVTAVAMTGCRSVGGWKLFAHRDAGSTLSSGPSTNYPMPPSAAATPEAIASIAGGTASPGGLGGPSDAAIAGNGSSAPPVSYAAAAANGFPSRAASFGKQNFGTNQLASSTTRASDNPLDVSAGTTRVDMSAYAKAATAPSTTTSGLNAGSASGLNTQDSSPSAPPPVRNSSPALADAGSPTTPKSSVASAFSLPGEGQAVPPPSGSAFGSVPPSADEAGRWAASGPSDSTFGGAASTFTMPQPTPSSSTPESGSSGVFEVPSMAGITPPASSSDFGKADENASQSSPLARTADASGSTRFSDGGVAKPSGPRSYAPGSTGAASMTYPGQKSDPQTSGSFYR